MRSHGTNKRFHYEKQDHSRLLCRTVLISETDVELEFLSQIVLLDFNNLQHLCLLIVLAAIVVMKFIDDRNCHYPDKS